MEVGVPQGLKTTPEIAEFELIMNEDGKVLCSQIEIALLVAYPTQIRTEHASNDCYSVIFKLEVVATELNYLSAFSIDPDELMHKLSMLLGLIREPFCLKLQVIFKDLTS